MLTFGEFEFEPDTLELRRAGEKVALSGARLRLLRALLDRPGAPVSKHELMLAGWSKEVDEGRLTVAIADLRRALGKGRADSPIATIAKLGYRFVSEVGHKVAAVDAALTHAPYVGREQLMRELQAALQAAAAGRGGFRVLIGEPGIGKTRAVEELERTLPQEVRSAWGYCRESGETPPLWPWQELLAGIAAQAGDGRPPQTTGDAPLLAALGTDASKRERFERAASAVLAATQGATWLLVLDDLHRADAASLELLLRVMDRIEQSQLLVVATLRPHPTSESVRHTALLREVLAHPHCQRSSLARLSVHDVAAFVATQVDDPSGDLASAVYQRSEGNPFFMTELVRQLGERRDAQAIEVMHLPEAALDLMRQRVQRLDGRARELLSVCAVIGRTASFALLGDVLQLAPDQLEQQLAEPIGCDLLAPNGEGNLRFGHDLIRGVVYEAIPPSERREWHKRVAAALERRRASDPHIRASDVAFHCHAALPEGDLRLAVRVCREAADESASVFGATDVAHYTYHALEALRLLPRPSPRLRMSLLYGLAIYSRPYDTQMYARCVRDLIALATQCESGEMLARATALLYAHPRLLPLGPSAEPAAQALQWLPPTAHGLRALALASRAADASNRFDAQLCLPLARRAGELVALAMAEAPHRAPPVGEREVRRASARGRDAYFTALLHLLYLDGDGGARSAELSSQLEELARRSPAELSTLSIDLSYHRAAVALSTGALEEALAALEAATARAVELNHAEHSWHTERAIALLRFHRDGSAEAADALRALHGRAAELRILGVEAFCAYDRAVVLGLDAATQGARTALRRALLSDPTDGPAVWAMKLRAQAAAGLFGEAQLSLRRVPPARLRALPHDGDYLGTLGHLARAALALEATEYYATLEELLMEHEGALCAQLLGGYSGWALALAGELAHAAGRHEQAIERLERALSRHSGLLAAADIDARASLARSTSLRAAARR